MSRVIVLIDGEHYPPVVVAAIESLAEDNEVVAAVFLGGTEKVDLAKGMSVPGLRVETPEQIAPAIQQMLATPGPFLLDLVLEGDTHPERIGNTCGQ